MTRPSLGASGTVGMRPGFHAPAIPVVVTVVAAALVGLVDLVSEGATHRFLLWNLLLASVPLPLALAVSRAHRRGLGLAALSPLLGTWLLFFPNSPYIATDLVHLEHLHAVPAPVELGILLSAALAGLLVGFASLALVEGVIADRAGRRWGRAFVVAALTLSSFGVYLGRFLRWNSWDVVLRPRPVFADIVERIARPHEHPVTWSSTVVFSLLLLAAYAVLLAAARRANRVT